MMVAFESKFGLKVALVVLIWRSVRCCWRLAKVIHGHGEPIGSFCVPEGVARYLSIRSKSCL